MSTRYSANQLKTWEKCQKKYAYEYVKQLAWPSNPSNFRLGKSVHQLMDLTAREIEVESVLSQTDSDIVLTYQALQASPWAQLPVIASEWAFNFEIDGRWLFGQIDRIVQKDDKIHVLDWKTGTGIPRHPETDWQTLTYLLAVDNGQAALGLSIKPEDLVFTYVQVKNQAIVTHHVSFDSTKRDQARLRLKNTLSEIEATTQYRLPDTCPDRFCPYGSVCGIQALTAHSERFFSHD